MINLSTDEGLRKMKNFKYLNHIHRDSQSTFTNTNITRLLKHAKQEEVKEKRKNIYIVTAAISVLALSGFIISQ